MEQTDLYGKDGAEVLARWDRGDIIHTIEMGGMGPGYEQCIQIVAMEVLRVCLNKKYDASLWEDKDIWARDRDEIDKAVSPQITDLGLSGAQWGAGLQLGTGFYMHTPAELMKKVKADRLIMASRTIPSAPTPA